MASVCIYFQFHQPYRLRRYSVFDSSPDYFDDARNEQLLKKIAKKCYVPAATLLLDLVRRHNGRFRFGVSLTGCVLQQFQLHCPEVITLLQDMVATGGVEVLAETSHHSLAFLYSRDEFKAQADAHRSMIRKLFGQTPRVFRNTELIYSNELAGSVASLDDYRGMLCEGADSVLAGQSPNHVYRATSHAPSLRLLPRNYRLSDDIAFRFSNRDWAEWPLTTEKFADWVRAADGDTCNLFMDIETFGEHQWADSGIFRFLESLPAAMLSKDGGRSLEFRTPSETIEAFAPVDELDVPHMVSWADSERDLTAWLGNAMQSNALHELYRLEGPVKAIGDPVLTEDWRRLTTGDHFYYMCTKYFADGDVHKYFNPYESPYDAYINFMNVLDNLRVRAEGG